MSAIAVEQKDGIDEQQVLEGLTRCALFRALRPEQIPQLAKAGENVRFQPGDVILKQGDPSDSFFAILAGDAAVTVERDGEAVGLGSVPTPVSVGEVGLLLGEPRTATVIARTEVLAVRFTAKAFEAMFKKIPDFGEALSAGLAHRLHHVSDRHMPVHDQTRPSDEVLDLLPLELQQRQRVLPLRLEGSALTLGFVDDPTPAVVEAVRQHLPGLEPRPVRIEPAFFNEVMRSRAGLKELREKAVAQAPAKPRSAELDKLLERMVAEGASDLHLSAGHKPHWRIDGEMTAIADAAPLGPEEVLALVTPAFEKRHQDEFAADSDTDLAYSLPGSARFRVNVFRDHNGVGAVLRQIPSKVLTFDQLGLPPVLKAFCEMPKGLVLVTGPTGSGKSTTLAAMIDYINKTERGHIITLEDPIEFVHQSQASLVNQREVGGHTKSFARALKACLREDPDVVLVGELRDLETIQLALETANTGHLVFATLHTNNAISAVDRMVDLFPADQQAQVRTVLADVLRGVVAQTLLRKKEGGRLAALEVLVVNHAISNLIREGKTIQIPGLMQASKGVGMQLLNDELARLVDARKIDMDEALAASVDKDDLVRRYRSGLTLAAVPGDATRFRVVAVKEASPGSEAGLERGDLLLELDQKPCSHMTLEELRVNFKTDGRRQLVVERGGKKLRLVFEMKR
jgi:twitching motility protein PilT